MGGRTALLLALLLLLLSTASALLHQRPPQQRFVARVLSSRRSSAARPVLSSRRGLSMANGGELTRRQALRAVAAGGLLAGSGGGFAPLALAAEEIAIPPRFSVTFPSGPVGIELGDALRGGACSVVVRTVRAGGKASSDPRILPGLGLSRVGYTDVCRGRTALEVAKLIKNSGFPLTLAFKSVASDDDGGDGPSALRGQSEVPARAVPQPAAGGSSQGAVAPGGERAVTPGGERAVSVGVEEPKGNVEELVVKRLTRARPCGMVSQEGDLLEIRYTARVAAEGMREYDSSDKRGTGQPAAITLGRGDVVRGLDLALYDMCIGERRRVEVPAGLAYGARGNAVFEIPPNSALVFGVQLVSINGVTDETATRGENYYTGDPCNDEARRAGVASGLCDTLAQQQQ